jgi:hypothetical protein
MDQSYRDLQPHISNIGTERIELDSSQIGQIFLPHLNVAKWDCFETEYTTLFITVIETCGKIQPLMDHLHLRDITGDLALSLQV